MGCDCSDGARRSRFGLESIHTSHSCTWLEARVKAMKDVDDDAEVKEAIEETDSEETEEMDDEDSADDEATETDEVEEGDAEEEQEEEETDIGSYVGLDIDGEEYYGTIVEFDDEEETVTIEEEETGDEIVGYQDEMFIPED